MNQFKIILRIYKLYIPLNLIFYGSIIIATFMYHLTNEIFSAMFPFKLIVFIIISMYLYFNNKNNLIYYYNLGIATHKIFIILLIIDLLIYYLSYVFVSLVK